MTAAPSLRRRLQVTDIAVRRDYEDQAHLLAVLATMPVHSCPRLPEHLAQVGGEPGRGGANACIADTLATQ